ncbi:hypothetical protein P7C70_g1196, partial [Phenoliferia sp. Uapishka_3]
MLSSGIMNKSPLAWADEAIKFLYGLNEVPWLAPLIQQLPAQKELRALAAYASKTTKERRENGMVHGIDLFHFLAGEDQKDANMQISHGDMDAENFVLSVILTLIAGSDTVASTLTFIFYQLIKSPEIYKNLQAEVEHFRTSGSIDVKELATLPWLNAIINETQRVMVVVPSRSQRIIGKGGAVILGEFLPAGTKISIPFQTIMQDPRNFSPDPKGWRPSRWIDPSSELAFNPKAFIPFSYGAYNCAGKPLALLEIRYLVTLFALSFDATFAEGFSCEEFEKSVLDRFTVQIGKPLEVRLTVRE